MTKSTKNDRKKGHERFVLDCFLKLSGLGFVVCEQREGPDFLLEDEAGRFGLELVQIFNDRQPAERPGVLVSPKRRLESERDRYLADLARHYYRLGGLPVSVLSTLPRSSQWPDVEKLAQRMIRRAQGAVGNFSTIRLAPHGSLLVHRLLEECAGYSWWRDVQNSTGLLATNWVDDLQVVIREKAALVERYRLASPRVSLLLHADSTRASGMIRWPDIFPPIEALGFDEIYLYQPFQGAWRLSPGFKRLHTLKPGKEAAAAS